MTRPKAKIAITVDPDLLDQVRAAVRDGGAPSVSGFFERAALAEIDADAALRMALDQALHETGGPTTDAERSEADAILFGTSS